MVAYSFKARFVEPIRTGRKPHTMRNERARHARAGEQVQLYHAMRTKQCFLIARATCSGVEPVRLDFASDRVIIGNRPALRTPGALENFAMHDGFRSWDELTAFWDAEHGKPSSWSGVIICWTALVVPA